ncbi:MULTISPECIES: esterase/lipase family protein [unclassified Streptomyces]|uniref:esterase/lipase family protein n=1 Tax=unclassified Streptomyces TaxID=2593676 RepID=UPI000938E3CB|nr:hypothetical protein [Streptomyces sp. TSRI0107]OKJ85444.1 hypothetical protein AMK31_15225 [Streptomyces sp. TSRI0107]
MPPTDLIVVLPGITGSTLRSPDGLVWSPTAGAVLTAIKTLGASLTRLRLPEGLGDEHPGDGVEPVDLAQDVHVIPGVWTPVKGYDILLDRLRALGYRDCTAEPDPEAPPGNLLPVPYDWRLSNRYNGRRLVGIVEPALARWRAQGGRYADARLVFVCHSMGGLVARWYVEHCGGAEHTRKLITFGTPYRGAVQALGQLLNGVRKGIGPLSVDLTEFARSMPSLHQLLPEYACIEHAGTLAKTTEIDIPGVDRKQAADAMRFHDRLREAEAARPASLTTTHAIVGTQQNTPTTATLTPGGGVTLHPVYTAENLFGDGTVPIVGACRADVPMDSNLLRRVPDRHGNIHRNAAALDELEGILTASPVVVRAPETSGFRLDVPELVIAGEKLTVRLATADGSRAAVRLVVGDLRRPEQARVVTAGSEPVEAVFEDLPPGAHAVTAVSAAPGARLSPVSADTLVWT